MTNDDERLDDDLFELVRREARAPDLASDHVARARERLEMRLFMTAGGGALATAAAAETAASGGNVGAKRAVTAAPKVMAIGKVAGLVALAFAGGVAAGWGGSRSASPAAPSAVATSAPVTVVPPLPSTTSSGVEAKVLLDAPSSSASAQKAPRGGASILPSADVDAAERSLLDQARRALREGEGERALDLVARHAHDFPKGSLVEEREVLRVNALVSLGRLGEAQTRTEAFRRRFPASPFLPALDSQIRDR